MHLALDEDRELLRQTVATFGKNRVRPGSRDWDEAGAVDDDVISEGWALGLVAAGVPEKFGGAAEDEDATPSALTGAIALEHIAWADLGYAVRLFAPMHVAIPVALYGTDEEKAEVLPAFCGEEVPKATGAWIEPDRTYDLCTIRTRAKPALDGEVLNGEKALVPGGADSVQTLVYARGADGGSFDGVHAYLVQGKNVGGLSRSGVEDVMGARGAPMARLKFEDCEARRLGGARGVSYRVLAARALTASAAAAVGVATAAAEYAKDYAKEREAFGRPIAQYQSIAFKIADAYTDAEAARWMTWKAAWQIDRGEDALKAAALAFRFASNAAWRIADDGVQILGGHGVIRDHLAELLFRNARTVANTPGWLVV